MIVCDGTRVLAYNLNDRPGGREGSAAAIEPAWKYDPENTGPQAFRASSGIPRSINILCDTALVYGYASQANWITKEIVGDVIEHKKTFGVFQR